VQRRKCFRDVGEVDHPTQVPVDRTAHVQRNLEAVAVQARTLVAGRNVRQSMRGF
jgi:hypothetical protein